MATAWGPHVIAPHERLVFLRGDRRLGVTNGTLGTVEHVASSQLQVRLDGPKGPLITFSLAD
jgi:ATP-dependent exoDNAse (exonuclease V) alpha subunit